MHFTRCCSELDLQGSCWVAWGTLDKEFSSVAQSCPTLCDPMDCSTPGLPVHHQLPEFTQTHVHRVSDAIQPSHPLSSPSPPASNASQHQSLFQWVNSSHEVDKVLEFQLQHYSLHRNPGPISFRMDKEQRGIKGVRLHHFAPQVSIMFICGGKKVTHGRLKEACLCPTSSPCGWIPGHLILLLT